MLEHVACDNCGKKDDTFLFKTKDHCHGLPGEFNIVKCGNCGLVYLNPRPHMDDIGTYYPGEYAPHREMAGSKNVRLQQRLLNLFVGFHGGELRTLWRFAPGKILDVGCGGGMYMKVMKDKGWDVCGVDASTQATQRAQSLGLDNVFTGELQEAGFPDAHFDVVLMRHSLEHMPHPSRTLAEVHRILKQDGHVLIVTPNLGSIEAKIFKEHWYQIDAPRHFYFLDRNTIGELLKKHGFSIVRSSQSSRPFSSFSWSMIYAMKSRLLRSMLDNAAFHIFLYLLFWPLHRSTSLVILARK